MYFNAVVLSLQNIVELTFISLLTIKNNFTPKYAAVNSMRGMVLNEVLPRGTNRDFAIISVV